MTIRKNIVRFWILFLLVLVLALGAITVAHHWHRIFPTGEVSEYYTRYAGREGMDVSYVKDYRVNDTIQLNVTLLEIHDSLLWEQVCEELDLLTMADIPVEYRERFLTPNSFVSGIKQDSIVADDEHRQTVFIYSHCNRTICIFHSVSDEEYDAIMDGKLDEIAVE